MQLLIGGWGRRGGGVIISRYLLTRLGSTDSPSVKFYICGEHSLAIYSKTPRIGAGVCLVLFGRCWTRLEIIPTAVWFRLWVRDLLQEWVGSGLDTPSY